MKLKFHGCRNFADFVPENRGAWQDKICKYSATFLIKMNFNMVIWLLAILPPFMSTWFLDTLLASRGIH